MMKSRAWSFGVVLNRSLRPLSYIWSDCSSIRLISPTIWCNWPEWVPMLRISGRALTRMSAKRMIRSPIARMFGWKVATSDSITVLPVLFIWSTASSSAEESALMSERSKGVMKLRRIDCITS